MDKNLLQTAIQAAIKAVPGVIPLLSTSARLTGSVEIKAKRDRRTWQGQTEKELQDKITGLMKEYWKLTAKNIANGHPPMTDEFAKKLRAMIENELAYIARDNAEEEAASLGIGFDPAAVDAAAEAWASQYSYDLIKGIDATTRETVSNAITAFTNTPGMTNQDIIDKLAGTFGEARAQMIAVTEVTRAFGAGEQIYQNMLQEMGVETVREWLTSEDERVCVICGALDGQAVSIGENFVDSEGNEYDNPPAHVNCILPGNEIACPDLVAMSQAVYDGPAIEFTFDSGRVLSVTQNHPILTRAGWVAAQFLNEGDYAIVAKDVKRIATAINPNYHYAPSVIEKVFSSLKESGGVLTTGVKVSPEDFHNDAGAFNGNIDIVKVNSLLLGDIVVEAPKMASESILDRRDILSLDFAGNSMGNLLLGSPNTSAHCLMCGDDLGYSGFGAHSAPLDSLALGLVASSDVTFDEALTNNIPTHTPLSREFILRFSEEITTDKIIGIREYNFSGHVYDLQTKIYELYTCNGIIVKNCRCAIQVRVK